MFAVLENVQIVGARPLEARVPEAGRQPRPAQCEVSALVNGAQGPEMKKLKAPMADLVKYLPLIGTVVDELFLDINEWEIGGRTGVTYKIVDPATK